MDGLQYKCWNQVFQCHAEPNPLYLGEVVKELKIGLLIPACHERGWFWVQGKSGSSFLHGPDLAPVTPAHTPDWELTS